MASHRTSLKFTTETFEKYNALKESTNLTHDKLISKLVDSYKPDTDDENEIGGSLLPIKKYVSEQSKILGLSEDFIIKQLLDKCVGTADVDIESLKGVEKIAATVRLMMEENAKAEKWYDIVAITNSGIFKRCKSNQTIIRKYLKDNSELIDAHHAAMKIDDPTQYNRDASVYKRREG